MWKQLKNKVRFILCDHPVRGQCMLMTNDWELKPEEAIRLYHARFGIEMSFKALVHTIGGFDYHFWMKGMDKLKRGDGDQYLHRKTNEYREKVRSKMTLYHVFVNLAAIAQGILFYLAIVHKDLVWQSFGAWMRTIKKDLALSEAVTSEALRESLSEYSQSKDDPRYFQQFFSIGFGKLALLRHAFPSKIMWPSCMHSIATPPIWDLRANSDSSMNKISTGHEWTLERL